MDKTAIVTARVSHADSRRVGSMDSWTVTARVSHADSRRVGSSIHGL